MLTREYVTELINMAKERCIECGHEYDHIEEHDALLHYAPCDYCDDWHPSCMHKGEAHHEYQG